MFCAWSLYVKPHPRAKYRCLDIDDVTEISYDWKSPYFFSELSATWDFSLPRTPDNEQLLIPKTNADGELLPFTDGAVPAYFIGLPWQEEEEIDAGELSIVKLSELRITVQFRQINTLFQKLVKLDGSALSIECESTYKETPPRAFLALGETIKANARLLQTYYKGCIAVRVDSLIEEILKVVGNYQIVFSHAEDIEQLAMYLLYEKPLISITSYSPPKDTYYRTNKHSVGGTLDYKIVTDVTTDYDKYHNRIKIARYVDGKGSTPLPITEDLYSFLQKLLQLLGLTLHVREFRSRYKFELYSIQDTLRGGPVLGELITYQWFPFKIPNRIPYTEVLDEGIRLENVKKNGDNIAPWEKLTYNAPYPNILYCKDFAGERYQTEDNNFTIPFRFYNREYPIRFLSEVDHNKRIFEQIYSWGKYYKVNRAGFEFLSKDDEGLRDEKVSYFKKTDVEVEKLLFYTLNSHIPGHPTLYETTRSKYFPPHTDMDYYNLYIDLFGDLYILRGTYWFYVGKTSKTSTIEPWRKDIHPIDPPFKATRVVLVNYADKQDITMSFDMALQFTCVVTRSNKSRTTRYTAAFWDKESSYRNSPYQWLIEDYDKYKYNKEHTDKGDRFPYKAEQTNYKPLGYSTSNVGVIYDLYGRVMKPSKRPPILPDIPKPPRPNPDDVAEGHGPHNIYPEWDYLYFGEIRDIKLRIAPPIPALNIRATTEIKDEPYFYIAQAKRLEFVADNPWLPHLNVHDSVRYWALVGDANVALEPIRRAYYNQFQRAILGDLRTWDEQQIFDNLYTPPYEPLDDPIRIGRQRVYSVKIKITRNEVRITGVTVVQYNK